jgi:hypothetical protein
MAGRFLSVLDVVGWPRVLEAVRAVRDSAALEGARPRSTRPLAVLVQPQIPARHGGVLFGADPVDGNARHLVVEIVAGNPSALVGGQATARHLVLSPRGRCISSVGDGPSPGRRERHALVDLAGRVERLFRRPQDVEWALGEDGRLWLLQSRPITAVAETAPSGPILGPGPVAETFPGSRRRCERRVRCRADGSRRRRSRSRWTAGPRSISSCSASTAPGAERSARSPGCGGSMPPGASAGSAPRCPRWLQTWPRSWTITSRTSRRSPG